MLFPLKSDSRLVPWALPDPRLTQTLTHFQPLLPSSAAPISTYRWIIGQCDGCTPEICSHLLFYISAAEGQDERTEAVFLEILWYLPRHPSPHPSKHLQDFWFFFVTIKNVHPCSVPGHHFQPSTKSLWVVWLYLNNTFHSLHLSLHGAKAV